MSDRLAANLGLRYDKNDGQANPFTTTPVQGANWDFGPNFGRAISRFAYTTPQSTPMSFGVRF